MTFVLRSQTVSVSIARPPEAVYAYLSDPGNLPQWATAFCRSIRPSGAAWIVETPAGPMGLRFVDKNAYGVLDHWVSPAPGQEILNPLRVVPNGSGSEVLFTLFQRPEMSDPQFAEDRGLVERDLGTLKRLLEAPA